MNADLRFETCANTLRPLRGHLPRREEWKSEQPLKKPLLDRASVGLAPFAGYADLSVQGDMI